MIRIKSQKVNHGISLLIEIDCGPQFVSRKIAVYFIENNIKHNKVNFIMSTGKGSTNGDRNAN